MPNGKLTEDWPASGLVPPAEQVLIDLVAEGMIERLASDDAATAVRYRAIPSVEAERVNWQ